MFNKIFGTRKSLGDKIVEIGDTLKEERVEPAKETVKELKATIELLNKKLKVMTLERDSALQKIKQLTADDSQDFSVDWEKMKPFSIERMGDHTNIGYFVDGAVMEWKMACSLETHRILVRQFEHFKMI